MPNDPLTEKSLLPLQKKSKWTPITCTIIYIILFPFLFYMALLSSMVSDGPSITPFLVGLIMFIVFLIPLSIPVSIYLMWSRYFRDQHEKAQFFAKIPLFTFAGVFLIIDGIPFLYRTIWGMFAS